MPLACASALANAPCLPPWPGIGLLSRAAVHLMAADPTLACDSSTSIAAAAEFRSMVLQLHAAGIEVYLMVRATQGLGRARGRESDALQFGTVSHSGPPDVRLGIRRTAKSPAFERGALSVRNSALQSLAPVAPPVNPTDAVPLCSPSSSRLGCHQAVGADLHRGGHRRPPQHALATRPGLRVVLPQQRGRLHACAHG